MKLHKKSHRKALNYEACFFVIPHRLQMPSLYQTASMRDLDGSVPYLMRDPSGMTEVGSKSSSIIQSRRGVTIIEILIGVSILVGLAGIGFFIGLKQYSNYVLESDWNTVASMLQTARARAMSNFNNSAHGLYFNSDDFVIFQGASYTGRDVTYDEPSAKSSLVNVTGPTEIIFNRLRGDLAVGSGTITFSNGERERIIILNNEGRISW